MPKVRMHSEQFDGVPHAWCGRGSTAVCEDEFDATDPATRCKVCEQLQYPHGQPQWHLEASQLAFKSKPKE